MAGERNGFGMWWVRGVLILLILRKHTDSQLDRLQSREHKRHILVGQEELENLHEVTALSVI